MWGRDYLVVCSGTWGAASRGEERPPDPGWEAPSLFSLPSPLSLPSSLHYKSEVHSGSPLPLCPTQKMSREAGGGVWRLLKSQFPLSLICVSVLGWGCRSGQLGDPEIYFTAIFGE